MEALFSYGTLKQEQVQLDTFGRLLEGRPAVLLGYHISKLEITDEAVIESSGTNIHPILEYSGDLNDRVEGMVFDLTPDELKRADDYEVDDYVRSRAELLSKERVWIYAKG